MTTTDSTGLDSETPLLFINGFPVSSRNASRFSTPVLELAIASIHDWFADHSRISAAHVAKRDRLPSLADRQALLSFVADRLCHAQPGDYLWQARQKLLARGETLPTEAEHKVKAGMIRLTRRGFTNKVDPGWLRASSIRSLFATQHGSRIFLDDDDWDVAESVEDVLSLMAQAQIDALRLVLPVSSAHEHGVG
jgi:hypothetical protein